MKRKIIIPLLAAAADSGSGPGSQQYRAGRCRAASYSGGLLFCHGEHQGRAETTATVLHGDLVPHCCGGALYRRGPGPRGERPDHPRASRSQQPPAIKNRVENWEQYDTVVIGYPIWNGDAPRIVSTFVQSYDFTGKKVAVFYTSGSSGVEDSQEKLRGLLPGAEFRPGIRFDAAATVADVRAWAAEADIG